MRMWSPRLLTSCSALLPGGAAALAAWQSQFRGAIKPPRLRTACRALPPEGVAAPAAWQSQFRGPCWIETLPDLFALC